MAETPRTGTKGSSNASKTESRHDIVQRHVLPMPDVTPIGLTTFDAKDPDTKYPPIRPVRPPTGAECAGGVDRRCGLRLFVGIWRAVPHAYVRDAGSQLPEVHAVPYDGVVLPDACCAPHRPESSHGRHGFDHRVCDVRTRPELHAAQHVRAAGTDVEIERLLDSAVQQMS